MAGQGASKRSNAKHAKARRARKKATKDAAKEESIFTVGVNIPTVTEDDLLAFQLSHFGDDAQPDVWFIAAETAVHYNPQVHDDDELGYYEDGVKRTLTDEQIEIFRHSEIEMIVRVEKLRAEEIEGGAESGPIEKRAEIKTKRAASSVSDASSIEDELFGLARAESVEPALPSIQRQQSTSHSSGRSYSTDPSARQQAYEIPYEQRRKRKWEHFIEENDPRQGSLTHRRIVRELDTQVDATVDLDY